MIGHSLGRMGGQRRGTFHVERLVEGLSCRDDVLGRQCVEQRLHTDAEGGRQIQRDGLNPNIDINYEYYINEAYKPQS